MKLNTPGYITRSNARRRQNWTAARVRRPSVHSTPMQEHALCSLAVCIYAAADNNTYMHYIDQAMYIKQIPILKCTISGRENQGCICARCLKYRLLLPEISCDHCHAPSDHHVIGFLYIVKNPKCQSLEKSGFFSTSFFNKISGFLQRQFC